MTPLGPRDARIVKHIAAIKAAGADPRAFARALEGVRDDPRLSTAMRTAIWKTLAQEAAQAYYVFTTGRPIDMDAMISAFEKRDEFSLAPAGRRRYLGRPTPE